MESAIPIKNRFQFNSHIRSFIHSCNAILCWKFARPLRHHVLCLSVSVLCYALRYPSYITQISTHRNSNAHVTHARARALFSFCKLNKLQIESILSFKRVKISGQLLKVYMGTRAFSVSHVSFSIDIVVVIFGACSLVGAQRFSLNCDQILSGIKWSIDFTNENKFWQTTALDLNKMTFSVFWYIYQNVTYSSRKTENASHAQSIHWKIKEKEKKKGKRSRKPVYQYGYINAQYDFKVFALSVRNSNSRYNLSGTKLIHFGDNQ